MKRRAAALVCALLLVFQLASFPAEAAEDVYFLAAEVEVLPLADSTMPFWHNGYLYIPASTFTGTARVSLGNVTYSYEENSRIAVLFRDMEHVLVFSPEEDRAVDHTGASHYPGGLWRNGTVYVPAAMVAKFFDLQYSVISVDHGHLVWLRKPDFGMSDQIFANAASYSMEARYAEYLKAKEPRPDKPAPGPADTPDLSEGKRVYLCLEAGADTAAQLDALDAYGAQAAFFCTPEFLETQGDLLRRMSATGQAVGILADARDEGRTVAEQLEAGNRALELATCGKTRLAYIPGGDEQTLLSARGAGFYCLAPDLDRADYELKGPSNAGALLSRITARRDDVSVWLKDTASGAGLRAFLLSAKNAGERCLALTETA